MDAFTIAFTTFLMWYTQENPHHWLNLDFVVLQNVANHTVCSGTSVFSHAHKNLAAK